MPQPLTEAAPAKLNLTLEIRGKRPDGYHELESLVAFAPEIADTLVLTPGEVTATTAAGFDIRLEPGHNILDRMLEALGTAQPKMTLGSVALEKRIPVAAGLGGGSADAAALLRALARLNGIADPVTIFGDCLAQWGADIPVCLEAGAAVMSGLGERVIRPAQAPLLPRALAALLVNPGRPLSTPAVFAKLQADALQDGASAVMVPEPFRSTEQLVAYMTDRPNDLQEPAIALEPSIADVLQALADCPGCRIARMSGSGATCFGVFDAIDAARAAHGAIRTAHPEWWSAASTLI